jgi:diguanylate cyclase (GGDEF)-like protein
MGFLDLRTILFGNLVNFALCTLVVALLWYQSRNRFPGLGLLVADYAMQASAVFLIALRGQIGDWFSMVLANSLAFLGCVLGLMGLERFVGKTRPQAHNFLLLAVYSAAFHYFLLSPTDLAVRNLVVSVGLVIVWFQCAWLLLLRVDAGMRPITRGVGIVFGLFCLVNLSRIVEFVLEPRTAGDYLHSGLFNALVMMIYDVLLILLTVGLVLMVNKRLFLELQSQEQEIRELSLRDSLTGLYNRRGVSILAEQKIKEANRGRSRLHLTLVDSDGLKEINDTLGHQEGDRALVDTAKVLQATFRESDVIARVGGDEFVVFSLESADLGADIFLTRLKNNIAAFNEGQGRPYRLAMSWGTAVYDPTNPRSLDQLLAEADRLMYQHKRAGSPSDDGKQPAD